MENYSQNEIGLGFKRYSRSKIGGNREIWKATFLKTEFNAGDRIDFTVPNLENNMVLVPGTLGLLFELNISGGKSYPKNNVVRLLKNELEIVIGGRRVYQNRNESIYRIYEDLWLPDQVREDMVRMGHMPTNVRKIISGWTEVNADGYTDEEKKLGKIYKKLFMPIDEILNDNGSFSPSRMKEVPQYLIKLPSVTELVDGETSGVSYKLTNLELTYEVLINEKLAIASGSLYDNHLVTFNHILALPISEWPDNQTIINDQVNVPRKSLKAIVYFFKKKTETDPEKYIDPGVTEVKVSVESVPSQIYKEGMDPSYFYNEAARWFCPQEYKGDRLTQMTRKKFHSGDQYCIVIDFRSVQDGDLTYAGRKMNLTKTGTQISFKRDTTGFTDGGIYCYKFVIADSTLTFRGGALTDEISLL